MKILRIILAFSFLGCSQPSSEQVKLYAQGTDRQVRIYWNPNPEPDMFAYFVLLKRPFEPNWFWSMAIIHPDTQYVFSNLFRDFPMQTIEFCVVAQDVIGNLSVPSDTITVFTDTTTVVVNFPPSKVGGVSVEVITKSKVGTK